MPPVAGSGPQTFEIKSTQLPLVAMLLKSADASDIEAELRERFGATPDFFGNDALLIDLTALRDTDQVPHFSKLLRLLREFRLLPVAARGGNATQMAAALKAGLAAAEDATPARAPSPPAPKVQAAPPAPAKPVATAPTAMLIDKPLRSGQQVYARGRDLVVLAMVNPGAEVIADGSIHVYAPLRGKAIAGARGDTSARIFAQALEPELVSIAGVYRTSDVSLPDNVRGKPATVRLQSGSDGDKLFIEPIL